MIGEGGGLVGRSQPPICPAFPPGAVFYRLYDIAPSSAIEAARSNAHAIAIMLREVGINVDALPLLDVRQPGANDIIGDRALGSEPRSEERRVGKECVSTCRSRWSAYH